MGSDIPKQFLPINGLPVLMRTIKRFREYSDKLGIILVLPNAQQEYWRRLCEQYGFSEDYQIADGGATRFHSVKSGLSLVPNSEDGVVGVHDGVRPFPSVEVIARCYEEARKHGAAVPATPVIETLRHMDGTPGGKTVPRSDYRLVQTPQAFAIPLLKAAYRQEYTPLFTDDASVVEIYGHDITIVEGNRENIKITTPYDMKIAETLTR